MDSKDKLFEITQELEKLAVSARRAWIRSLPILIGRGCTSCDNPGRYYRDFLIMETGYQRFTSADISIFKDGVGEVDPEVEVDWDEDSIEWRLFGRTNGWDDFSEDGDNAWVTCEHCGAAYRLPREVEWA